ncbi:hypothetical protein [Paenibacillus chitinolyticus]|uniref:hypothetical protein n=1 Tax=Paenibacillus chitinolyticus TaxID=79263 RepID=UPI003D086B9F
MTTLAKLTSKRFLILPLLVFAIMLLSACGAINKDFSADTKEVVAIIEKDMNKEKFDSALIQETVKLYFDKWGSKVKEGDETAALKQVGELMGITTLYSVEKDSAEKVALQTKYREKLDAINQIISQ